MIIVNFINQWSLLSQGPSRWKFSLAKLAEKPKIFFYPKTIFNKTRQNSILLPERETKPRASFHTRIKVKELLSWRKFRSELFSPLKNVSQSISIGMHQRV